MNEKANALAKELKVINQKQKKQKKKATLLPPCIFFSLFLILNVSCYFSEQTMPVYGFPI